MTATELRHRLYQVLSEISETKREVHVTHKGRRFRIVPDSPRGFLDSLVPHDTFVGSADKLVEPVGNEWVWNEDRNLDDLS